MEAGICAKKEIVGIDILRFLCALSVVFCHLLPPIAPALNFAKYGGSGVDIFFVISGFIIPKSSEGRRPFSFIQSRVVRLLPAVWICATLTLAVHLADGENVKDLVGRYLRSLFFVPVIPGKINNLADMWMEGVYWTLFVELAFYSLILYLLFKNAFNRIAALATALGCISLIYWSALFCAAMLFPSTEFAHKIIETGFKRYLDLSLVHHGAWFGLGINIWLLTRTSLSKRLPSLLVCLAGGLLQEAHHSLYAIDMSPIPAELYCLVGISIIYLSVFSPVARVSSEKSKRVFRWMGLTTYPLYLVHDYLGFVAINTLSEKFSISRTASTVLSIPSVIGVAFLIAYYVEPPFQKVLKTRFEKARLRFLEKNVATHHTIT